MRNLADRIDYLARLIGRATDRLADLERERELDDAREEERSRLAVRAAARATRSERRRMAYVGAVVALLSVVSPHVHL